ncbi:DEAD/DEAH box helicase [Cellulomonas sp. WB94]|uniref:DEAD/DEAH box helicase n=1 Tax=Cellulomonas sp. WB94 TaxID=2173174 RepID=UPI001304DB24|nr:DEAD/DEAH box helicase [Cellulomonas sp. WB94]
MEVFAELKAIAALSRAEDGRAAGRDRLIRFLDSYGSSGPELPVVDSLCAHYGLFPYMSASSREGTSEALALEFHSPESLAEEGFTFHAMQQHVFSRLMDGESLILSAPTSFGKSAILDALVASNHWSQIVLIVPTIALIDETRRRLARFRGNYTIITHASQSLGDRNVFVLTQERFLEFDQLPDVDFFVIDEFYKLGSSEPFGQRRSLLNIAWKRLRATGAQYYLIGPNVDSLDEAIGEDLRTQLVTTDFRTVAVDVDDRSAVPDQLDDLLGLVDDGGLPGSTLFFTGSPEKAEHLALAIGDISGPLPGDGLAALVADWISSNYDDAWNVPVALARGVGVHTGPLPRSIQRIMVRLFNEGHIAHLVCTSTLIEGVNTAARNVVVFEKKIDGQLLDFFTFSNIRGRAGRMFRHFVGHVVTYTTPPAAVETVVDIPIESQSRMASLATLIQLQPYELDDDALERAHHVFEQTSLSVATIRKNRGLDPDLQIQAAEELRESRDLIARLGWSGIPDSAEFRQTLKLAFDTLLEGRQRRGINFDMMWGQLQNARVNGWNFGSMVDQQSRYARPGMDRSDVIREVLKFQRNWMGFTIPSMLRGMQSIQNEVAGSLGERGSNYEFALRQIESLYLPNGIVDLEEYGVPTPLGAKLSAMGLRGDGVAELLDSLMRLASDASFVSQLSMVEQWILKDVVVGHAGPSHPFAHS